MTFPNDLEMLDELIERYFSELMNSEEKVKLGDLIKMIELRRKLAPDDSDQRQFWKMLDKIRREALPSGRKSGLARKRRSKTGAANLSGRKKRC